MLCQHCGQDTKEGFPYCTSCGEWVGSRSVQASAVPGSWGNPSFEGRAKPVFLLRTDSSEGYREPDRMPDVPAATQRVIEQVREPQRRPAYAPAASWTLHARRA